MPRKDAAVAAPRAIQCQIQTVIGGETLAFISKCLHFATCLSPEYRNKIGLDVALEALREAWRARRFTMDKMYRYARICRVERVMRPYLEALVA